MVEPGHTCPTCERKVPHPKKPTSPDSKPVSYRVPLDELEAHKVIRDSAAQHLGTAGRPHEDFWTYTFALAAVLQDEELRGVGVRSEVAS